MHLKYLECIPSGRRYMLELGIFAACTTWPLMDIFAKSSNWTNTSRNTQNDTTHEAC